MMLTDFHSHILPGIDDGSASLEESLDMLFEEAKQGITHVIATPHFYARYDKPEDFLARRNEAERQLRAAMVRYSDLPRLSVGAEVYFFRGMSDSEFLSQLTIQGKRCILVEMPHAPWSEDVYHELNAIWEKRRLRPIVAHVDRYIGPFRTHGIPKRLEKMPVLVQANADFFLAKNTARMAMRMLKADQIQLLGSDCHNMTSRKPNLLEAVRHIEEKLGKGPIAAICDYEDAVLS